MMPLPFEIAATLLGLGAAAGTRASLALLVVSGAGRFGWVAVPPPLTFVTSTPMLGALVAAVVLEEFLERDDTPQELLAVVRYGVHGTGAVIVSWLLIERFHLPLDGWPVAAIGGALALLTHGVRVRLHDALRDLEAGIVTPRRWLSWLEVGSVAGLVTAVLLAPMVAAAFALVAAVVVGAAGMIATRMERAQRLACPTCQMPVRKEARLCPHCKEALSVGRWVGAGLMSRAERLSSKRANRTVR